MVCYITQLNKVYDSNSTKPGGEKLKYTIIRPYTIYEVLYYLKVDCDKLKMYTIHYKSTTKTTTIKTFYQ